MAIYAINETFSKEEWDILQAIKLKSGLTWKKFILEAAQDWDRVEKQDHLH